jgi:hypothetical protein
MGWNSKVGAKFMRPARGQRVRFLSLPAPLAWAGLVCYLLTCLVPGEPVGLLLHLHVTLSDPSRTDSTPKESEGEDAEKLALSTVGSRRLARKTATVSGELPVLRNAGREYSSLPPLPPRGAPERNVASGACLPLRC